jgi:hypothetical protein
MSSSSSSAAGSPGEHCAGAWRSLGIQPEREVKVNTIVKAAAVQISPVLYSRQGVKKLCELGKQDVQFATFPEAVVPYYPYFSFVQPAFAMEKEHQRLLEGSVTVPSAETRAIGEAAKDANMVVSIGVNERDGGSIYNTQLLFDADGTLIQRRRKITPTYHERMIWGQGDGSGLCAVDSAVGRIGQLACWEHYLPLARYALSPTASRSTRRCIPDRSSVRCLRSRQKPTSVSTLSNPLASWLARRRGSIPISRLRS